jgi:hypothetical protein
MIIHVVVLSNQVQRIRTATAGTKLQTRLEFAFPFLLPLS